MEQNRTFSQAQTTRINQDASNKVVTNPTESPRPPIDFLGVKLPGPISSTIYAASDFGRQLRQSTIKLMPGFIVNSSASLVGLIHMVSEVAMFKANGSPLILPENKNKPLHYLIDPPINIMKSVTGRAKFEMKASDLLKPKFYRESAKSLVNLEEASRRDLISHPVLINSWQARATLMGMTGWGINMITPNAKQSAEDIENMVRLRREHPAAYVGECLRRAVVFPFVTISQLGHKITNIGKADNDQGMGAYKRQFTGLAVMFSGLCSFLGGFRNVKGGKSYYFNWQYCATGAVSFISSIPLLFSVDNDEGYARSGALHLMRVGFLPGSIVKKFRSGDDGAGWYLAGHVGLQSENAFAALVAGAEKRPDGTIVDYRSVREEAKEKHPKRHRKEHKPQHVVADDAVFPMPATKVTQTESLEKVMPVNPQLTRTDFR